MSVAHLRDCPGCDERRRLVGTSWAPYIERDVPGNDRPAGSLDHSSKSCTLDLDEWSSDPAGRSFPGTSRSIYGAHEVPTNRRLSSHPGQSRRWATDMIRPARLVHAANTNF